MPLPYTRAPRIGNALPAALLLVAAATAAVPALAYDRNDPDWPCQQRRVAALSAGQIWDGPPVDGVTGYQKDAAQQKLIKTLASRRVPTEEAVSALKDYANGVPEGERKAKLTQLFAGLLASVNTDRSAVMAGIVRFSQRQRDRARELEREGSHIVDLKAKAEKDSKDEKARAELDAAQQLYDWNVRVFQERQGLTPIACEIPVLMESRIFEMAREIRALMPS